MNLPEKSNFQNHSGMMAITGKSNFDISEWMLIRMCDWLNGKTGTLAMLCKSSVARKVLNYAWEKGYQVSEAKRYAIDASKYFGATVDACLLVCNFLPNARATTCKEYASLDATSPSSEIGYKDGMLIANMSYFKKWKHLLGNVSEWRSGIKHDCSKVMELSREGPVYVNGLGERVELEDSYLYPMLKSSDLMNGRQSTRWMIVTQKQIGGDTSVIKLVAPRTWAYLNSHADLFSQRASSIYKGKPQFSIFGVGNYSFSLWKVAISALYKRLEFGVVGRIGNKPTVLDDTSNFFPCKSYEEANSMFNLLNSDMVKQFYNAFIFWDEKRPVTVGLLKKLDIRKAFAELGFDIGSFDERTLQGPLL